MGPVITFPLSVLQPRNSVLIEEIDVVDEILLFLAFMLMIILDNLFNFLNIHVWLLMRTHWNILEVINNVLLVPLRLFEAAFL